jgi:hypothetical protein
LRQVSAIEGLAIAAVASRPIAYFDGTLKVFHPPYLPAIRNASMEPLPDRPEPRAQFERRRDEFLPRDLTLLHAAARYTM